MRRWWAPLLGAAVLCYYALLLTNGLMNLWTPAREPGWSGWHRILGFTFNSMLLHLLHGEFDVDPEAIKWEAFARDGKTYAYFGILPALVRLPLLPFFDLKTVDVSALTCLAAVLLALGAKLSALRAIATHAPDAPARRPALLAAAVVTVLGGAQIQFLRVSVYQEGILWAGALAAVFVALAVYGLVVARRFSTRCLVGLAVTAGLCLLARVSIGLGLSLALLALLARVGSGTAAESRPRRGRLAWPVVVLAMCAAAVLVVNYERFGHPLRFAPLELQTSIYRWPVAPLEQYGMFNFRRLPYGLMYYFAPVWLLRGADGTPPFYAFRQRAIDLVELPPSSFLLSDPLLVVLAVLGVGLLLGRRPPPIDRPAAAGLAAGLAVSPLLMLIAWALAFRYRMEFYPLLEFLAFLALARSPVVARAGASPRLRHAGVVLAGVSVVASHALLLLYKASMLGSVDGRADVLALYGKYLGQGLRKFLP